MRNGVVSFDRQGQLLSIESCDSIDSQPATEYYNGILIPGMVNAHCHLELSFFKGAIPQATGLVDFIKHVISNRGNYDAPYQEQMLEQQDRLMWSEGIQAVGDISNDTISFATKAKSPIYYHTFAEYFGIPPIDDADIIYQGAQKLIEAGRQAGITITETPHSTYLVSDGLFRKAVDSDRLSIHFMETAQEVDFFDHKGEMYDFVVGGGRIPDFLFYGSHPERLIGSLPSDTPLLLVHVTQMKREDIERVMAYFTNVTFVLCPRSNYYIGRDFPPAELLYELGCRVAMGTDSLSSNTSLSIAEEIKWLALNNPDIPLEVILSWATIGGAKGLAIDSRIGSFEVGKTPGAVLLSDIDFATMRPTVQTHAKRLL